MPSGINQDAPRKHRWRNYEVAAANRERRGRQKRKRAGAHGIMERIVPCRQRGVTKVLIFRDQWLTETRPVDARRQGARNKAAERHWKCSNGVLRRDSERARDLHSIHKP